MQYKTRLLPSPLLVEPLVCVTSLLCAQSDALILRASSSPLQTQSLMFLVQRPDRCRALYSCPLSYSRLYKQLYPHTSGGRWVLSTIQTTFNNFVCCPSRERASAFSSWIEMRSCRVAAIVPKQVASYADSDLFKCSGPNLSLPRLRVSDVLHGDPKFERYQEVSCSMFSFGTK